MEGIQPRRPHLDERKVSDKMIIPKQFTVKAHIALFEGEGRGRGAAKKIEEHFSQEYNFRNTFPS